MPETGDNARDDSRRAENEQPTRQFRSSARPRLSGEYPTSKARPTSRTSQSTPPSTEPPQTSHAIETARNTDSMRNTENKRSSDQQFFPSRRELRNKASGRKARAGGGSGAHARSVTEGSDRPTQHTGEKLLNTTAGAQSARHTRRVGETFPTIVGWTSLGTFLPGAAFIKKRQRVLGWTILIIFLGTLGGLAVWVAQRGVLNALGRIASSPSLLHSVSFGLAAGVILWAIIILASYIVLRRGNPLRPLQRVLGGVLVVSLILITAIPLSVGAVYARVQSNTIEDVFHESDEPIKQAKDLWAKQERVNVFLLGSDSGKNRTGTRPDTMLVASIDTSTGNTALISVPRNLALPIFPEGTPLAQRFPNGFNAFGYEQSLINSVWTWAEAHPEAVTGGDTGSPESASGTPTSGSSPTGGSSPAASATDQRSPGLIATMQAVEGSLGVNLDYYAIVNMQGFQDVIAALGGVTLDVERPIPMGGGHDQYTGTKNEVFGWIDPGVQKLKGKKALWYVRSREGSDNYDRMCRQQRLLKATLDQLNPRTLTMAYPELAESAKDNVRTNIPQSRVPAFIELALMMQEASVNSAQINNDVVNTVNPDYSVLHNWVDEIIAKTSKPSPSPEASATAKDTAPQEDEAKDTTSNTTDSPQQDSEAHQPAEQSAGQSGSAKSGEGVETADGKCYPAWYTPGDPWPGYPGNDQSQK